MPYRNRLHVLLASDGDKRHANSDKSMRFDGEPEPGELCRRISQFVERLGTITPDEIKAIWEFGDMSRPTSRQIGRAARNLVLSGDIEIIKTRDDGRTVTHYVRLKK